MSSLKNTIITYAIPHSLSPNCTSYQQLYPVYDLIDFSYNKLTIYLLILFIIGFIVNYDKIWLYESINICVNIGLS